jgi:hypothetical protein
MFHLNKGKFIEENGNWFPWEDSLKQIILLFSSTRKKISNGLVKETDQENCEKKALCISIVGCLLNITNSAMKILFKIKRSVFICNQYDRIRIKERKDHKILSSQ